MEEAILSDVEDDPKANRDLDSFGSVHQHKKVDLAYRRMQMAIINGER